MNGDKKIDISVNNGLKTTMFPSLTGLVSKYVTIFI